MVIWLMRTIIAGSRDCTNPEHIIKALNECDWTPTVVISGAARGADRLGKLWARANNIPCEKFPANWDRYGKSAGYRRNVEMAESAEALLALWDGKSKGTKHMINIANSKGLKVHVFIID